MRGIRPNHTVRSFMRDTHLEQLGLEEGAHCTADAAGRSGARHVGEDDAGLLRIELGEVLHALLELRMYVCGCGVHEGP